MSSAEVRFKVERAHPAPQDSHRLQLDRDAGVVVKYVNAPAEDTGLSASEFDLVTAGQCRHWFDRPRAAAKARRAVAFDGPR